MPSFATSWLDEETLLVAGPGWGIAAVDPRGQVERTWLGPEEEVLDVCAFPGETTVFITTAKDRIRARNDCIACEVHSLDLESSTTRRLTNDVLYDELLCPLESGNILLLSRHAAEPSLLMADWDSAELRRLDVRTGEVRALREWYGAWYESVGAASRIGSSSSMLLESGRVGETRLSPSGEIEATDYPWVIEGRQRAVRWRFDGESDEPGYFMKSLDVSDLSTGQCAEAFRCVNYSLVYEMSLSPDERYLSFIVDRGSMRAPPHTLWIVDCSSMEGVAVKLPLAARSAASR